MSDPYLLLVNDERTILVRIWPRGTIEAATRPEEGAIWGPPHRLYPDNAGTIEERFQLLADVILTPAQKDVA